MVSYLAESNYDKCHGIIRNSCCFENNAEILPAHFTWKVAEKGFKMVFMSNKFAMINSCEIILEK